MKYFLPLLLCLCTHLTTAQNLNPAGHIITNQNEKSYSIQNDGHQFFVEYQGESFPGNAFYPLKDGFATIEHTCGNTPSTLRIYSNENELIFKQQYNQTLTPQTDQSKQYLYFQDSKKTIILDTKLLTTKTIPTTTDIAINKNGDPIYFDAKTGTINYTQISIDIHFLPLKIEVNTNNEMYVFGRHEFAILKDDTPTFHTYQNGNFFESKVVDGEVYWVEKNRTDSKFRFELKQYKGDKTETIKKRMLDMETLSKNISRQRGDGEQILCPMFPDSIDYPFRIGNSYAEHQRYGSQPYLHPGVDIIGEPYQAVYAPVGGHVKAILTTGGFIYWRLALALKDSQDYQDGYLFAHLDPATIPFAVGDSVSAGDYLGFIVEWPTSEFHHLHFARIEHSGPVWDGNWFTKDNVLADIINFRDDSSPVFEPLWNDQTIAFRSIFDLSVLSPDNLHGAFDIICHVHDLGNDDWRVDVDSIGFEIIDLSTGAVVHEQESFSYDFTLDVYDDNDEGTDILNTIYSTINEWQSLGNYSTRNFYQQVSRSNGDGIIDEEDQFHFFDSKVFPDGSYLIRVHAFDAKHNHSSTELEVVFNNTPTNVEDLGDNKVFAYPNPSNGYFQLNSNGEPIYEIRVLNTVGKRVHSFSIGEKDSFTVPTSLNGAYLLQFYDDKGKMLNQQQVIVVR